MWWYFCRFPPALPGCLVVYADTFSRDFSPIATMPQLRYTDAQVIEGSPPTSFRRAASFDLTIGSVAFGNFPLTSSRL